MDTTNNTELEKFTFRKLLKNYLEYVDTPNLLRGVFLGIGFLINFVIFVASMVLYFLVLESSVFVAIGVICGLAWLLFLVFSLLSLADVDLD